ncbi:CYFA0S15e00364g1_1 [Cyberlindnera fabianii]|uniref:CYFA0S15e00364g1_1 n=1 Tax=Cyberlindnera fabianii TaxID=36022 RepID=A0A061B547_CYBFA|nr:CYFA0S15e00364g1_1 [Cyberlindnera fabianii]
MSLSEIYTLTKFPRVSGTNERAKIATSASGPDELHIAISGASISQYVLKPSPKLVWSHSVPPSFVITAVAELDGEGYVIGLFNKTKKTHSIQVIQKLENDSKVVKEWDCNTKTISLSVIGNTIVTVHEDSVIAYNKEFEELWVVKSLYASVYSEVIENNVILVVEHDSKKHNLGFKLLSSEGAEISSKIIEFKDELANLKFAYSNGTLYKYTTDTLTLYRLPRFESYKTLNTTKIGLPAFTKSTKLTLVSPASDRLLIAQDSELYLINTNFGITVSQVSSPKNSKCEILFTQHQQKKRSNASLFAVLLRESDIAGVNFTLDTNTLRDSLGKGFTSTPSKQYIVPSILDIKVEEFDISTITKSSDFDSSLLEFLHAEQDYYTENDRVVDSKFMHTVVSHVFESESIPERAMTYLLTHPLFPPVDGLLSKLRAKPRLLRQAVVTANVSLSELVAELNTTENEDIFKDIITRLLEFPKDKLDFKDLDSHRIVERILSLNFGHELISLLIDASGMFTWSDDLIEKLQEVLQKKIDALNAASRALAVIEQVEVKNLKTVQKVPVYSIEKLTI